MPRPVRVAQVGLPRHRAFLQGLLSALLNPKLGVFFLTLLPQFIAPGDPPAVRVLQLALLFDLIGITWLLTYSTLLGAVGDALASAGPATAHALADRHDPGRSRRARGARARLSGPPASDLDHDLRCRGTRGIAPVSVRGDRSVAAHDQRGPSVKVRANGEGAR